jgi:hypothetical protein
VSEQGPIFLAGTDRSGIGLVGEILSAHPNIFISRRTRFWNFYYDRYGDLGERANLVTAVDEMMQYTRILDLKPDRDRLLAEFAPAHSGSSYGVLFALIQRHHVEGIGKRRWGDKTINAERYASTIFEEFPTARMIHVLRDPRDRYASQAVHRNASRGKVGAGSALWLSSLRRAKRNVAKYADRYQIVRYEDLVTQPTAVVARLCRFIDEPFHPQMTQIPSPPREETAGADDPSQIGLVASSIGRFARDLTPREIAFIQLVSRKQMRAMRYEPITVAMSPFERLRFTMVDVPLNLGRMAIWWGNMVFRQRTGGNPSRRRTVDAD